MTREEAANLYEEDAAEIVRWLNLARHIAQFINDAPREWLEEQASSQLANANLCRTLIF